MLILQSASDSVKVKKGNFNSNGTLDKTCGFEKQYAMFGLGVPAAGPVLKQYRLIDETQLLVKFSSSSKVFLPFLLPLILVISRYTHPN